MMARSGLLVAALAAVGAMAAGMGEARADIIASGVFTSDHCDGGCLTRQANGGGTVTVTDHQNGTLDFDIELANGNVFVGSGLDATFGFNLVGNPTITYSNVSWLASAPADFVVPAGGIQNAGTLQMDGTGNFEYGLDVTPNGHTPGGAGNFLKFSISGTGLDIGDLAELSTGPGASPPQIMAADIFSGTTGKTGAVDITPALQINQQCVGTCDPSVPEPASFALLGAGLIGLGFIRRRRA